jgi:hypothetical protein
MRRVTFKFEINETVYYATTKGIRKGTIYRANYSLNTNKLEYHLKTVGEAFFEDTLFKSIEELRKNLKYIDD